MSFYLYLFFLVMKWIVWWMVIKLIFGQQKWGKFPIMHGAYYSKYFGGEDAANYEIWAAISTSVTDTNVGCILKPQIILI